MMAVGAGVFKAWPHCLQKRLPGAIVAPHFTQNCAAGAGAAVSVIAATGRPHPPQKRLPAGNSLPQFEQFLSAIAMYRILNAI
jgi:hypothetical protein